MRFLQRGYTVCATVRDPGNMKKVKPMMESPNADTNLTVWKADLGKDRSFDGPSKVAPACFVWPCPWASTQRTLMFDGGGVGDQVGTTASGASGDGGQCKRRWRTVGISRERGREGE
ncbi:dihydroflavonol 4-reductase-like [Diospyros lotus]|uniref:dihydroflavonol 4-reductase-like n=1 Tax=Diospyros lotus TaxID=55363 RepID=UPI00224CBF60|nr:dihydroflavonol 4-reductase-like [Diospyros lotus]